MIRSLTCILCVLPGCLLLTTTGCEQGSTAAARPQRDVPEAAVEHKEPQPEPEPKAPPKKARTLTFDDLAFDIEKGEPYEREMLTESIEALDGERVQIRGYILPTAQQQVSTFTLVRDNKECCFGPRAAIYDNIKVNMQPGDLADYTVRPVAVEGTFRIDEFRIGNLVWTIFFLDGSEMK